MANEPASSSDLGNRRRAAAKDSADSPFRYIYSLELPSLLERLCSTLVVSTYQAGKLVLLRAQNGRLSLLPRTFEQAMGVAISPDRLAIGTRYQIWILENDTDLARTIEPDAGHDACYLPRRSHVTGNIHIHEMAWGKKLPYLQRRVGADGGDPPGRQELELKTETPYQHSENELWFVNTAFSCLCTLDAAYSFVPRWQPSFITEFAAQDCCHLNGLAMEHGRPKFVTVFAETNEPDGWRANKATTGCVIDVESGGTITRGLAMPHSPRLHEGRLYALDSGTGRLVLVDPRDGHTECVASLPGYTRGLALYDRYAFVGLSKIRETTTFGGVPIADRRDQLKCGVWIVDITTGSVVSFLEFEQDVTEIFDVQILAGVRNPSVIGLRKDTIERAFVLPKQTRPPMDRGEQQSIPSGWRGELQYHKR